MKNNKKILLISSQIPNSFFGGGALTSYSILRAFLRQGYEVISLCWRGLPKDQETASLKKLNEAGAVVRFLKPLKNSFPARIFSFLGPENLLPHRQAGAEAEGIIADLDPKAVVLYHWEALSVCLGIRSHLKIGLVGDPLHLPYLFRSEFELRYRYPGAGFKKAFLGLRVAKQIEFMKRALLECASRGAFACHHAEMLRELGIGGCRYFRTPLPDPLSGTDKTRRLPAKPKILLLGHLRGIATLSGISLFADKILPELERKLGRGNFEVHIVGGFFETLPPDLKKKLLNPPVVIRGHINPADEEFLTSHLLLVPTPIELGIRVRIITAFSFGTPVVAHSANKKGIPELEHGKTALLSETGEGLAEQIALLLKDEQLLSDLSYGGRKAYQDFFSLESAGSAIVSEVERICA